MVTGSEFPDDETLLAYVRGDLEEGERARIAELERGNAEVAADIALIRGLRAASAAADAEVRAPGTFGWARLAREMDAAAPRAAAPPRRTWGNVRPLWQLAAAAVVAVGLWQVAVVPYLTDPLGEYDGFAPLSEAPREVAPQKSRSLQDGLQDGFAPVTETPDETSLAAHTLRVAFLPGATEGEIRELLQQIGGEITGGPSVLGLWTVSFPDDAAQVAGLEVLLASPLVEGAVEGTVE